MFLDLDTPDVCRGTGRAPGPYACTYCAGRPLRLDPLPARWVFAVGAG